MVTKAREHVQNKEGKGNKTITREMGTTAAHINESCSSLRSKFFKPDHDYSVGALV